MFSSEFVSLKSYGEFVSSKIYGEFVSSKCFKEFVSPKFIASLSRHSSIVSYLTEVL